jgi:hypothetical protein
MPTDQGIQQHGDTNMRDHEPHHPYRVRGLSANEGIGKARALLRLILEEKGLGMRLRALARDAYDPRYNVATVSFQKKPKILTPNKSEWRFLRSTEICSSEDEKQLAKEPEVVVIIEVLGETCYI